MATIEYYREREAEASAEAQTATSDHARYLARRSEGAWRKLAELGEKKEGRLVPVGAAPPPPEPKPKKKAAARKPVAVAAE